MKTSFIPIDYDYFDFEGKNYIKVIGRDSSGKRVCIVDDCEIYFWAILNKINSKEEKKLIFEIKKIEIDKKNRTGKVNKIEIHEKKFLGKSVRALKIFTDNYKDLHDIASNLDFDEISKRRGYDLGFVKHYILEKKLFPLYWYEIEGDLITEGLGDIYKGLDVDFVIKLKRKKEVERKDFLPKILSYDIECDDIGIGEGEILMISLVSDKLKKVVTWKKTKHKEDFIEYVKDESELIEKFIDYVKKISPDILVGYFSDGFDLPYIKARAEKLNIKLNLGLDDSQPKFNKRGIEVSTGKISGIVHIDLIRFIKTAYSQYMQSETLSLNEVASEFLGEGKDNFKWKHSSKIEENDFLDYFNYNLRDSILVKDLFYKMWPDIMEFSRIIKDPIFEITRNGMSKNVESYIINNLEKYNEIPEKKPINEEVSGRINMEKYEGAFVFEPKPGIYEDIAMFDFTSSYGSVIVSYNLSKATLLENKTKDSNCIEIENQEVCFDKKPGFFPEILNEIISKRKQYKKELNEKPDAIKKARSNAFKLLANAYYGYLGFFGARYYSREAAAATAAFARKSIKEAIEEINNNKFETIYSDTDSIAFTLNGKTKKEVLDFLKKINKNMPGIMELELEGFFKRGIWVSKRSGAAGAKKKYALIDERGKMKIRGFETVRRDWCRLARNLQNNIIKMILEDGDEKRAMKYLNEIIEKLKNRKVEKSDLIIKTALKKPINEYLSISPHVIAAKKMKEKGTPLSQGNVIEYYIGETKNKTKLVREKVRLPEEEVDYDEEYYLEKQIIPAVENIFLIFGLDVKSLTKKNNQKTLFDF